MMLAHLQHDFRSWLVTASSEAATRLGGNNFLDFQPGLSVYQNNYRAQLVGCLEESFPKLRTWMGEEAFLTAAMTHINHYPPHSWTLDAYAVNFHKTLRSLYPDNPDIQELAWIEHALSEAFVAPDAETLSLATLSVADWDLARLHLSPSFRSFRATTNAEHIWSALWEGKEVPESEMLQESGGFIVWRWQFTSCLQQVDALEHKALLQLQENGSFAALCNLLVETLGESEGIAKAGTLLAHWLSSELIHRIEEA